MATIGELIEALRGAGPDSDPIRPEDTDGNGLLEPYHDDIPTSVKEKIGQYLNKRTSGDEDLSNTNMWPVEDTEGSGQFLSLHLHNKLNENRENPMAQSEFE